MRPEEAAALGEAGGGAVCALVQRIEDMHEGVAERVFSSVGPAAEPIRAVHDRVARRAYAAVRQGSRALGRVAGRLGALSTTDDAPALEDSVAGRLSIGALNGAFGDALETSQSPLALPMTLRRHGRAVEVAPAVLAEAYPDATGRLAVFLHGLCETDDAWRLGAQQHAPYGARLRAELHYTPLYVRYNTGLHISENGRRLAELLEDVFTGWPLAIDEITLIGHSMGALVARSACHYGARSEWVSRVRHVFALGAPHGGASLEQLAHAAGWTLAQLPETRSLAAALNSRSAGIKDLRYGSLLDDDWSGTDPDAFLRNTCRQVPFLDSANHYFVSATLSRDPTAPMGRLFGDMLVLRASAWAHGGRGERLRFPVDHYAQVGGVNHFQLLNHPAVYQLLRKWLAGRPALVAPA